MRLRSPRLFLAAAALAVAALGSAAPAMAETDSGWFWGGGDTPNSSGREFVRINTGHSAGEVVVSFGDRRLYFITKQGEAISYPIAIPREQSRWQGNTSVSQKRENPSWTPTAEMRQENPKLPNWVPGGHPMNPLGVRALYLGSSTYRIHGTDAPWTIGSAVSKGCIRMYNQDVIDLYPRVKVGAKVLVTWQTFKTSAGASAAASDNDGDDRRKYKKADTASTQKRAVTKRAEAPRTKSAEVVQ